MIFQCFQRYLILIFTLLWLALLKKQWKHINHSRHTTFTSVGTYKIYFTMIFSAIKPNKQRKPEFCAINTEVIVICISMVNECILKYFNEILLNTSNNFQVLPSQRQEQKQNLYVWIIVNKGGCILTGNCTCMAGSVCSHVAAVLFKIEACIRLELHKVSSTSSLCQWKKSRKQVAPALLSKINFQQPETHKDLPRHVGNKYKMNFATKNVVILGRNLCQGSCYLL